MQRNGSATSSKPVKSQPATLTSEASLTCDPTNSAATPKPISLPESEDGQSRSASLDGPTTDLFGQALAPASHSLPPARVRRPMTSATCGLRGFLLSPSSALQSSLESRLRRRLDGAGSTLFSLTWNRKATPAGRPYFQLAASGRHTSDSDSGLSAWPTPNAGPQNGGDTTWQQRRIELKQKHGNGNGFGMTLGQAASLAPWPTPMAGTPAQKGYNEAGNNDSSRKVVALAGWRSPAAQNGDRGGQDGLERIRAGHTLNLQDQALLAASGPPPNGSPAPMERPGQLDPDHSRWVMGYETEHLSCAPTETPSFLRSQQNLSAPQHSGRP